MIERELIDEIRTANDIASVVSGYVRLKRTGGSLVGLCPFHNEKTPSFHVMDERQSFHCFGCGAGGNVITFVMMIENYDFLSAVKFLADRANIALEHAADAERVKLAAAKKKAIFEVNSKAARFFYDCLGTEAGRDAVLYMDGRGIPMRLRTRCGLGYSPGRGSITGTLRDFLVSEGYSDELLIESGLTVRAKSGNGFYDRFFERLMFPIFDVSGKIAGFGGRTLSDGTPKYLNSPETPVFEKGRLLYGLNFARGAKKRELYIVEGYMDVISMQGAGFMNTVASLGTAFTPYQARLIKNYADTAILLYDSDEAGVKAVYKAIPQLVGAGLSVKVAQTEDAKDPDEYIKRFGAERLTELLAAAKSHVAFRIDNERERFDMSELDQRVAFTREASRILSGVDSEIERDAYIKETARLTGISEQAIRAETGVKAGAEPKPSEGYRRHETAYTRRASEVPQGVINAQKRLLGLAASDKGIFLRARGLISETELTGDTYILLYRLIAATYAENRLCEAAELISAPCFDTVERQREVSDILYGRGLGSGADIAIDEKEFADLIRVIRSYGKNKELRLQAENNDANAMQAALNQRKSLMSGGSIKGDDFSPRPNTNLH